MTKYEKITALDKEISKLARQGKDFSKQKAEIEYMVGMIAADCEKRKLEKQNAN